MESLVNITAHRPMGSEFVYSQAPAGLSIAQMLWNGPQPEKLPYSVTVFLDGREVTGDLNLVYPAAESLVVVRTLPGKGGDVLRAVLMIAVIVAATYIAGPVAGFKAGSLAYAATLATVATVGFLAVNALIPPQVPDAIGIGSDLQESPTLWVSGAKNRENRWGTTPVILGAPRTVPFYAAKPYTEIVGNDQYFRALYFIGYGPLQLSDFRFGNTYIVDPTTGESNLHSYEMEVRAGYEADPPITLFPSQVDEVNLSVLLSESSGWHTQTTEAETDEFSVDYAFMNGLTQYDNNGDRQERLVQLDGRYRNVVGPGAWRSFGPDLIDVHQQDFVLAPCYRIYEEEVTYRWDVVCTQKIDGRIRIVSGTPAVAPYITCPAVPPDCFGLAQILVVDDAVATNNDIRNVEYEVTGMAVSVVSGLTIRVAVGTVVYMSRLLIIGKTSQALRGSIAIRVPARGQYEVELKRLTADSTDTRVVDLCTWITLRSIKNEHPINFPHPAALIAVRIKITDQMSSTLDEFNCVAASIVKDYEKGIAATISVGNGGNGYSVNDVLTVVQSGGYGCTVTVTSVDSGVVNGVSLTTGGMGYVAANGLATTVVPAGGTGCLINILTLTTSWITRASDNPASLYRHILQGAANPKPAADPKLDLEGWFEEFWQFCSDQGFGFNAVLASKRSVLEQCQLVCAAGRATPQRVEGKWAGVIDRLRTAITGHYTPHNSWGMEFGGSFPDLPHAWRVRFLDQTHDWQELERIVYADGYNAGNATLFEAVDQIGVTDPDQIWKLWRYNYACAKLRPFPFSFYVDWEHLSNTRGDLVRCTYYNLSGQVFSGRLKDIQTVSGNHVLTLDNAVTMITTKTYTIRIRIADDPVPVSVSGTLITEEEDGEYTTITVNGLLSTVPAKGDLFQFGEQNIESIEALIKEIEPMDKLCARVTCLDYAPGVFDADTEEVPEWNPVFNELTPLFSPVPEVPMIVSEVAGDAVIIKNPDGGLITQIGINYAIPSSSLPKAKFVQIQYRPVISAAEQAWILLATVPFETGIIYLPVDAQIVLVYEYRLRSISESGAISIWSAIQTLTLGDLTVPVSDISGLSAAPSFRVVEFTWNRSLDRYHKEYTFRTKVATGAWSSWFKLDVPFYTRNLLSAEIDAYGIGATIYIEVKDINVFGEESAAAAEVNGQCEPIEQVDLSGSIYQIVPTDSNGNSIATLKSLYDAVIASGGVAYDGSSEEDWVQYGFPVSHIFNQVLIWPSASMNCYLAYSEDGIAWNYLKAESDHTLDADGKLLEAASKADAQANYWTTGTGSPTKAVWPYMRQGRYLRLYIKSEVTIYELKWWTYVVADEIDAGVLHLAKGISIASAEDPDNAVIVDNTGLKAYGGGNQKVSITASGITIGAGSGYANISDKPSSLYGINSGEGTKLGGIEAGADVTSSHTAAYIASQGALATVSSADFATQVTGAEKPASNATVGATWGTNLSNIPATLGAPSGSGLFLSADHLGFYTANGWKTYIDNSGNLILGDIAGGNTGLSWNQGTGVLSIKGSVVLTGGSGYANISDKPSNLSGINSGEGTKLSGIESGATVGATWGSNITSQPSSLSGINSGEGSKLSGIEAGADVTSSHTAAYIASQGALATVSSADFASQVTGAQKPANNADVTDYTDTRVANAVTAGGITTILRPAGGAYNGTVDEMGAIKITLPQSWTDTMLRFVVDIYLYDGNKSFSLVVGGYVYPGGSSWYNCTAQLFGDISSDNRVRFGHDGTKCCIVIGEVTSVWQYPKIVIKNFQAGHSSVEIDKWDDGWSVGFITSISGITFTGTDFANTLIDAAAILNQGALATLSSADFATQVSGTEKPASYATVGATWGTNLSNIPATLGAPSGSGLFLSADHLGFYATNEWKAYIDNSGNLILGDIAGGNTGLSWNQGTGVLSIKGAITIVSGSVPNSVVTGLGSLALKASVDLSTGEVTNKSLANVDSSANTKLGGIEAGADVTSSHTAAYIASQGALATVSSADFATQVGGAQKPANNATVGATWGTNISNQPSNLSGINSGEGTKLSGIEAGADVTSTHTAAYIANQGALAIKNAIAATDLDTTIISGGKIITGLLTADNIQTGTLLAARLATNVAYITQGAMISNAIIGNAHITDLDVNKLSAGTITSKAITLAVSGGTGDTKIQAGKTDFNDNTSGFIIGIDDSDSDYAKIEIGDANAHMKWNPATGLQLKGKLGYDATFSTVGILAAALYSGDVQRISDGPWNDLYNLGWTNVDTWNATPVQDSVYPDSSVDVEMWVDWLVTMHMYDPKGAAASCQTRIKEDGAVRYTSSGMQWVQQRIKLNATGVSITADFSLEFICANSNTYIDISNFQILTRYKYERILIPG